MSYRFTGSPDPETAAAIIACIETVLDARARTEPIRIPAWRLAGIRENVAPRRRAEPGASWPAAIAAP